MLNMTKEQRLLFGESLMTHAMTLTGVSVEVSDKLTQVLFSVLSNVRQ